MSGSTSSIVGPRVFLSTADGRTLEVAAGPVGTLTVRRSDSDPVAPVVEFHHAALDHYFMTQDAGEIRDLDSSVHPGRTRTGEAFLAYVPGRTLSAVPSVARFYGWPGAGLDSHFYTADARDLSDLTAGPLSSAWVLETRDAFQAHTPASAGNVGAGLCPAGWRPVHRLWNRRSDSNHRYTTSASIKAEMIARGYVAEGYGPDAVALCAPPP